ncbi:MAG: hypothetical protein SPK50_10155 [Mobiluncus porci]|uniref:hypothetical protein n=1 Tax=Mobiluncus porci TaxID=2652278 RepID=UPI0023F54744|nr:hypothetical protein [Mobiluncus porci]MDD7541266.1 hypothetical protein [Mobiluncus porci]MDY5749474.1 hypothetical protein [Mobiluncus porci]
MLRKSFGETSYRDTAEVFTELRGVTGLVPAQLVPQRLHHHQRIIPPNFRIANFRDLA